MWTWLKSLFASRPCQLCGAPAEVLAMTARRSAGDGDSTTFRIRAVRRFCKSCAEKVADEEA